MKKLKVIIWGLGSVGRYALKMIQQKKSLELVGAIDVDPAKIGKDAGEIFDFEKTGVLVSNDVEATMNIQADVVLYYTPYKFEPGDLSPTGLIDNAKDICIALKSKKNVISTLPIYISEKTAPDIFKMINDCAKENGTTYVQQGIFPGLFNPYLPVVVASMGGRVDSVIVYSGQDDSHNTAPWVQVFGYGKKLEEFNGEALKGIVTSYYGPTAIEIAERCGIQYDRYELEHEIITAKVPMNPPCNKVEIGTIAAHIFIMRCMKGDKEVTGFHFVHKVCHDLQPEPSRDSYFEIIGEPNITVRIDGMLVRTEPFSTSAAPSVNLIPIVVSAEPGFKGALDLPASTPAK